MKKTFFIALGFLTAISFSVGAMANASCVVGSNQSWLNCLAGSARNNDLASVGWVVLSGVQLPKTFQYVLGADQTLALVANGQEVAIATRTGQPQVIPSIRYDQELSPVPGLEITQTKTLGATTASCYHNALDICMKNYTQAVDVTTTLKINDWSLTKTESTFESRGEVLGFFCCK